VIFFQALTAHFVNLLFGRSEKRPVSPFFPFGSLRAEKRRVGPWKRGQWPFEGASSTVESGRARCCPILKHDEQKQEPFGNDIA